MPRRNFEDRQAAAFQCQLTRKVREGSKPGKVRYTQLSDYKKILRMSWFDLLTYTTRKIEEEFPQVIAARKAMKEETKEPSPSKKTSTDATTSDQDIVTREQLAAHFRCSQAWISRMEKEEGLPSTKFGPRRVYSIQAVEAWTRDRMGVA